MFLSWLFKCYLIAAISSFISVFSFSNFFNSPKILTIWILVWIALWLFNTLESINTPCSVKTLGNYVLPPLFEVTNCDLKDSHSLSKSDGLFWSQYFSFHFILLVLFYKQRNINEIFKAKII